ncbi:hypothetical protein GCM10009639_47230 [Kitasatospora putterlickiae]|uniref:Secreted protein n=1 Tax=Kitasatospora putterlickiae TaxID=221725 RepID=A0ABN1YG66_9ACTN
MSHIVLAIGTAAITASGCVWYLPAIADLQAGEDRPRSSRTAAAACVTWWAFLAMAGGLLLAVPAWQPAVEIALAGLVAGVLLRVRALLQRRAEQREEAVRWALIDPGLAPLLARPSPRVLLGWLLVGLAVASLGAASILLAGGGPLAPRLAAAVGSAVAVSTAFLLIGLGDARHRQRA